MPFGVKNTPAVFQELMLGLFRDNSAFYSPYMNDLIIFSACWECHVTHVRQVLSKLRTAGLTVNTAKCRPKWSFGGTWSGREPCPSHNTELKP